MFAQNLEKTKIWESNKKKLLGAENDTKLDKYIASLCRKAGKKLFVLARLSNFMCTSQKELSFF